MILKRCVRQVLLVFHVLLSRHIFAPLTAPRPTTRHKPKGSDCEDILTSPALSMPTVATFHQIGNDKRGRFHDWSSSRLVVGHPEVSHTRASGNCAINEFPREVVKRHTARTPLGPAKQYFIGVSVKEWMSGRPACIRAFQHSWNALNSMSNRYCVRTANGYGCPVLAVKKLPSSRTRQIPRHPATPLRRQLRHPQNPHPHRARIARPLPPVDSLPH